MTREMFWEKDILDRPIEEVVKIGYRGVLLDIPMERCLVDSFSIDDDPRIAFTRVSGTSDSIFRQPYTLLIHEAQMPTVSPPSRLVAWLIPLLRCFQ